MRKTSLIIAISSLLFVLPSLVYPQCCNYQNSGQNIGTSPTFGIALGDFDGDGDQDVFTIDAYEDMEIYFNNGSGVFTIHQTIIPAPGEQDNYGVHVTDVDSDGDLDAIVIPFYSSASLKIYKNNGSGTFTLFQTVGSNLASRYAAVVDLDGDGDKDIFLPGGQSSVSKVFKNTGNGTFNQFSSINLVNFGQAEDITYADFDGDGDVDIVLVSSMAGGRLLLNDGFGNFTDSGQTLGTASDNYYTVAAGDLDKDGDADLAIGSMYSALYIFKNDGQGNFSLYATLPSGNYDKAMKILDMDFDSDLDIFVSTFGSHGLEVWSNDGEANFSLCYQNLSPMPETYSHGFDVGMINNDNYYDAFMGEFGGDGDKVFFGDPLFSTTTINASICEGETYTFPNGTIGDTTGINYSHFTAASGCDSNIITTLTVNYVNELVSQNQYTLTSLAPNATYRWLDCNNGLIAMPNQTNQSFTATISGSYAVEVTQNSCVDTSVCYPVVVTGMPENKSGFIQFYPNPVSDKLTLIDIREHTKIQIINAQGSVVFSAVSPETGIETISLSEFSEGLYFLRIIYPDGNQLSERIIKSK